MAQYCSGAAVRHHVLGTAIATVVVLSRSGACPPARLYPPAAARRRRPPSVGWQQALKALGSRGPLHLSGPLGHRSGPLGHLRLAPRAPAPQSPRRRRRWERAAWPAAGAAPACRAVLLALRLPIVAEAGQRGRADRPQHAAGACSLALQPHHPHPHPPATPPHHSGRHLQQQPASVPALPAVRPALPAPWGEVCQRVSTPDGAGRAHYIPGLTAIMPGHRPRQAHLEDCRVRLGIATRNRSPPLRTDRAGAQAARSHDAAHTCQPATPGSLSTAAGPPRTAPPLQRNLQRARFSLQAPGAR
jgi:hypothetical protein